MPWQSAGTRYTWPDSSATSEDNFAAGSRPSMPRPTPTTPPHGIQAWIWALVAMFAPWWSPATPSTPEGSSRASADSRWPALRRSFRSSWSTCPSPRGGHAARLALDLSPNPTHGRVRVAYSLPEAAHVRISMYDVQGRRVATLADEFTQAGRHDAVWDSKHQPLALPPGVYKIGRASCRERGWIQVRPRRA